MSASEPRAERPAMASYGVTADPSGLLPWSWAETRLLACRNYWVATADLAGRPHALPVWGVWLPDRAEFAFSCAPDARKARNIAANPAVCVMVDDTVECVSLEGVASALVDPSERAAVADVYAVKYAPGPERAAMSAFVLSNAMFTVRPRRGFGIIEREAEFATRATRWVW